MTNPAASVTYEAGCPTAGCDRVVWWHARVNETADVTGYSENLSSEQDCPCLRREDAAA